MVQLARFRETKRFRLIMPHDRLLSIVTFSIRHQSGKTNRVADALSRRHTLLGNMHTSVMGFATMANLYIGDNFFGRIFKDASEGLSPDYTVQDGFLFIVLCLCFLDCNLRLQIIQDLHNERHVGHNITHHIVTTSYFGPVCYMMCREICGEVSSESTR